MPEYKIQRTKLTMTVNDWTQLAVNNPMRRTLHFWASFGAMWIQPLPPYQLAPTGYYLSNVTPFRLTCEWDGPMVQVEWWGHCASAEDVWIVEVIEL